LIGRPSPSLVVAIVALFLACTGTAVAIKQITSAEIKNHTIRLEDVSAKAKSGLRGKRGKTGPRGLKGDTGPPGPSALDGGSIPSGTTVTGAWGGRYVNALEGNQTNSYLLSYSFPLPAPVALTDASVNFGASTAAPVGDADPACTGSAAGPSAPAGKVCIYVNSGTRDNTTLTGFKLTAAGTASDADRYGFEVRMVNINAGGASGGTMRAEGTWAYTAP
jgi:hypothetical protein